jgi:hypothetical protein
MSAVGSGDPLSLAEARFGLAMRERRPLATEFGLCMQFRCAVNHRSGVFYPAFSGRTAELAKGAAAAGLAGARHRPGGSGGTRAKPDGAVISPRASHIQWRPRR